MTELGCAASGDPWLASITHGWAVPVEALATEAGLCRQRRFAAHVLRAWVIGPLQQANSAVVPFAPVVADPSFWLGCACRGVGCRLGPRRARRIGLADLWPYMLVHRLA